MEIWYSKIDNKLKFKAFMAIYEVMNSDIGICNTQSKRIYNLVNRVITRHMLPIVSTEIGNGYKLMLLYRAKYKMFYVAHDLLTEQERSEIYNNGINYLTTEDEPDRAYGYMV